MAEQQEEVDSRKFRRQFENYASVKGNEIDEQRLSWRYYHAAQWSAKQLKFLEKRGQPVITFDRTGRKIDGLAGTIRKLRTDPKAYPKSQQDESSADIATEVVRTVCDSGHFEDIEAECVRDAAVHGIAVDQLTFVQGDQGDPDIAPEYVDPRTFFYDPRSVRADFADARFMGVYKWADADEIDEISPGASKALNGSSDGGIFTAFDTDRDILWVDEKDRYRLVDHWYIEKGKWKWCLHVGGIALQSGDSPFFNGRGQSISKFFAFANYIDHDGDHYGYIRRLKGPQDAINQHRSKAMHIMNTRQLKLRKGAVLDVEVARREAAKADGVIEYQGDKDDLEIIQPAQEFLQQTQYFQDAKSEIETFGPNPALLGDMGASASGRAYAMAQQAGLAELGPFLKNYRSWKLAQYEAMWYAARRYWTAERMLRVTDDQGAIQFLQINGQGFDEQGRPANVNALGAINVDILIDEGPDTETVMGDVFDTLTALAQNNVPVPPQVIIEASSLPGEIKKKLTGMMSQPDPMQQQAAQIELAGKAAEVQERNSKTALNMANARKAMIPEAPGALQQLEFQLPPELQVEQALADIGKTRSETTKNMATASKTQTDAMLAPQKLSSDIQRASRPPARQSA